jgi:hypothetical protein
MMHTLTPIGQKLCVELSKHWKLEQNLTTRDESPMPITMDDELDEDTAWHWKDSAWTIGTFAVCIVLLAGICILA